MKIILFKALCVGKAGAFCERLIRAIFDNTAVLSMSSFYMKETQLTITLILSEKLRKKLRETNKSKEALQHILWKCEKFQIKTGQYLQQYALNQELNLEQHHPKIRTDVTRFLLFLVLCAGMKTFRLLTF